MSLDETWVSHIESNTSRATVLDRGGVPRTTDNVRRIKVVAELHDAAVGAAVAKFQCSTGNLVGRAAIRGGASPQRHRPVRSPVSRELTARRNKCE